jgi:prephenate dehydrogenase
MSLRRGGIHVTGYNRRHESCRAAIDAGAIDEGFTDVRLACRDCDAVVVAAPVDKIAELAAAAAEYSKPDALITDVGSTKSKIVEELSDRFPDVLDCFVAAHPIAGSEKTGAVNASESLLDGKVIVITPHEGVAESQLRRAESFWRQTGGEVVWMSPEEHDQRLAAVSHLPHLISSLLATFPDDQSAPLVGSGWKDMTRVAAGDPTMWSAICQHNRDAILSQIDRFGDELAALRRRVADADSAALLDWLTEAKRRKDQIG